MKKKKSGKRIFAIVLLVVIGIGGFYFGYDIGRMDHDEERIRAELKKTTADSEISIRPVAKGGTGKTEIEILTECLEDAKDSLENLEKYNEQLQALDGKTPDTETVVLIQDLDDKNEKAYEVLKDLTEDPAGYIAEKAAARGEGDEVWADDWAADIQVVKWLKENDGKRLYKENQAYILKILAFQEKAAPDHFKAFVGRHRFPDGFHPSKGMFNSFQDLLSRCPPDFNIGFRDRSNHQAVFTGSGCFRDFLDKGDKIVVGSCRQIVFPIQFLSIGNQFIHQHQTGTAFVKQILQRFRTWGCSISVRLPDVFPIKFRFPCRSNQLEGHFPPNSTHSIPRQSSRITPFGRIQGCAH